MAVLVAFWLVPVGTAGATTAAEFAPVDRPGPALTAPAAELEQSIVCTEDVGTAELAPVLLLPATTVDSEQNFGWNWFPALRAEGFPVCTSDVPSARDNMGDHQVRAEYVVHAIRRVHALGGGRPIGMVGHSQGGQIGRFALRFWPDTRPLVADYVSMAAPNHGTQVVDVMCADGCAPALWQQAADSAYMTAMNSVQETFAGIAYTNVYSRTDEFVQPNLDDSGTSSLRTGDGETTNVAIQEVCPTATSEHLAIGTQDAVAWALGLDALTNDGPAAPGRIPPTVCLEPFMPGVDATTYAADFSAAAATVQSELADESQFVDAEPELRCFVFADCDPAAVPNDATDDTDGVPPPDSTNGELATTGGGAPLLALVLGVTGLIVAAPRRTSSIGRGTPDAMA